jgi:hypothetical protein
MGIKDFMTSLFSQCKVNKVTLVSVPAELQREVSEIIPQMQHCGLRVTVDTDSAIKHMHIWSYPDEVNLEELNKLVVVIG